MKNPHHSTSAVSPSRASRLFLEDLLLQLIVVPGYSGLGFECFVPLGFPWIPFWFLPGLTSLPMPAYILVGTVVWFLAGSLIGLFVQYLKSKQNRI